LCCWVWPLFWPFGIKVVDSFWETLPWNMGIYDPTMVLQVPVDVKSCDKHLSNLELRALMTVCCCQCMPIYIIFNDTHPNKAWLYNFQDWDRNRQ
jgi:hypothetical protein